MLNFKKRDGEVRESETEKMIEKLVEYDSDMQTRDDLKKIYREIFCYNCHLSDMYQEEKEPLFLNVILLENLQLELSRLLMENDLLKMYDIGSRLLQINMWQILLLLLACYLEYYQVTFTKPLVKKGSYSDLCM